MNASVSVLAEAGLKALLAFLVRKTAANRCLSHLKWKLRDPDLLSTSHLLCVDASGRGWLPVGASLKYSGAYIAHASMF